MSAHSPYCHRAPGSLAVAGILGTALVTACGSAPLRDDSLGTSRELFAVASETPEIYRYASSDMRQANRYLQQAQEMLEEGGSQDELEHLTFLARKHVAVAEARMRRGLIDEKILRADQRRETLVLSSEKREAAAAVERAAEAEDRVAEMGAKLATSERRAQALAEKLVELGVSEPASEL